MSVLKSFFFFLFASAACTVPVLCLWADIYLFNLDIPEISLTEIVQETVLGGIVFIHFLLAKKWAFMRYCNILIGGFFLSMLIRELDAFFDLLAHGSWVWFALLSAVCALLYPVIHYRLTLTQLAHYTRTPWYGVMLSGLLAVWSSPDCLECTGYGTRYLIKATSGWSKMSWRKAASHSGICSAL